MRSKLLAGVMVPFLLAACDGASDSGASGTAAANQTASAAQATGDRPDRATAQAALDFIVSRINETDVSRTTDKGGNVGDNWTPSEVKLGSGKWTWTERRLLTTADQTGVAITDTTEHYALAPRDLNYPTMAKAIEINGRKMWSIQFECATNDCITVTGERADTSQLVFDSGPTNNKTQINMRREENSWYFYEEDVAKRVAHAMDVVLAYEGGVKAAVLVYALNRVRMRNVGNPHLTECGREILPPSIPVPAPGSGRCRSSNS